MCFQNTVIYTPRWNWDGDRIRQEAAGKKKHRIRLAFKRPGQAEIEAEATISFTYYRRTLL